MSNYEGKINTDLVDAPLIRQLGTITYDFELCYVARSRIVMRGSKLRDAFAHRRRSIEFSKYWVRSSVVWVDYVGDIFLGTWL